MKSIGTAAKSAVILLAAAALSLFVSCGAEKAPPASSAPEKASAVYLLIENDKKMLTSADLVFDAAADEFLKKFALGDTVTVQVGDFEPIDVPVCADASQVTPGEAVICASPGEGSISLACKNGEMGVIMNILEAAEGAYKLRQDAPSPVKMTVTVKEKNGFGKRLALSGLIRADNREDYAAPLTDEQFANFREITTRGMKHGVLFRSSSPIAPGTARNTAADALAEKYGILSFINLSDTEETAAGYGGFAESYYASQKVIYLGLPVSFSSDKFSEGFGQALRFIIENEPPYLIHCLEGKDRTGFAAAVLELLAGADIGEIENDYLLTYENFYAALKNGGEQLNAEKREIIRGIITNNLRSAFGIEESEPLTAQTAEKYLLKIGLTENEISKLKSRLSE